MYHGREAKRAGGGVKVARDSRRTSGKNLRQQQRVNAQTAALNRHSAAHSAAAARASAAYLAYGGDEA